MKTFNSYLKIFKEYNQARNDLLEFIKTKKDYNNDFRNFCSTLEDVTNDDLIEFSFYNDKIYVQIKESDENFASYLSFDKSLFKKVKEKI